MTSISELLATDFKVMCGTRSRSEEHTSELQSQSNLVCRLLLEKKKKTNNKIAALKAYQLHIGVIESITVDTLCSRRDGRMAERVSVSNVNIRRRAEI